MGRARHAASRWVLAAGLALLASLVLPRSAEAYPWMLRHGYGGCSTCHLDPSGGGLLTPYGRVQGFVVLAMPYGAPRDDAPTQPLWGAVPTPDWLLLGGAFQQAARVKMGKGPTDAAYFPMQSDLYGGFDTGRFLGGGSLGISKVPAGMPQARDAQVTRGEGDTLNLVSRTHWLGVRLGGSTTLRAGRLDLPYALRMPEHTMWVRSATRTDRESDQQHGVAVAYGAQQLRGELMAILGNYQIGPDRYRERGYSGFMEWLPVDRLGLGLASRSTISQADPTSFVARQTVFSTHGLFTRMVLFDPLYVQGEVDLLWRSRYRTGYAGLLQANLEVIQGLHLIGSGEVFDGSRGKTAVRVAPGAGKPAFGGWLSVDWYFAPQLSLRVDWFMRQSDKNATLLSQLHMYL